jgi:GTP-binding protein HflX
VRHLPHQLVEAFRSTLEESAQADLLVHVVDASDPLPEDQIAAVRKVLVEIGEAQGGTMPSELLVVNKVDAAGDLQLARLRHLLPDAVFVSAHRGDGIEQLKARLAERLPRPEVDLELLVPYTEGGLVARLHTESEVLTMEHVGEGTRLHVRVGPELAVVAAPYVVGQAPRSALALAPAVDELRRVARA